MQEEVFEKSNQNQSTKEAIHIIQNNQQKQTIQTTQKQLQIIRNNIQIK